MKNVCTLFFCLAMVWSSFAQITVNTTTLPAAGDVLEIAAVPVDVAITTTLAGPNQTWNYESLTGGLDQDQAIVPASSGSAGADFPDADIVVDFFGFDGYAKVNPNSIEVIGVSGEFAGLALPFSTRLIDPAIVRRAPMQYNDVYSDDASFGVAAGLNVLPQAITDVINSVNPIPGSTIDSIRVSYQIEQNQSVDAWGNMTTPGGSADVLRVSQMDVANVALEALVSTPVTSFWVDLTSLIPPSILQTGTQTFDYEHFYASDFKEPILSYQSGDFGLFTNVQYKRSIPVGVNEIENIANDMHVFPNPVKHELNLNLDNIEIGTTYQIQITDMSGRLIWETTQDLTTNNQFDVSAIEAGLYHLRILNEEKTKGGTRLIEILR